MDTKMFKIVLWTVCISLLSISLGGCGKEGPSDNLIYSLVKIVVDHQNIDPEVWQKADSVIARVTGTDFLPIVDTNSVDSLVFWIDTPTGDTRVFTAFAIDTNGTAYCWGRKDTSVTEDDTTEITIGLKPLLSEAGDSIIILRDSLPWNLTTTDSILENIGVTTIIVSSDSFADLTLDPVRNTVIVPSDQPQEFYDNYSEYVTKFNNFIFDGGVMFFSACHKGWNNGDINASGFLFPSGVRLDTIYRTDTINIVSGDHPLLEGLDTLKGYFASYGWFADYPPFAHVLTKSPDSDTLIKPTLLLYQYGSGLILLSSQPLEYSFACGSAENRVGILLPSILTYLVENRDRLYLIR